MTLTLILDVLYHSFILFDDAHYFFGLLWWDDLVDGALEDLAQVVSKVSTSVDEATLETY